MVKRLIEIANDLESAPQTMTDRPSIRPTARLISLRITSVSYGRMINLGKFESARIDATADVPDGDDPDDTWTRLVAWVAQRVVDTRKVIHD